MDVSYMFGSFKDNMNSVFLGKKPWFSTASAVMWTELKDVVSKKNASHKITYHTGVLSISHLVRHNCTT